MSNQHIPYDRKVLVQVLIYHQRQSAQFCACGAGQPGMSHAEHVAEVYEQSVTHGGTSA